MLKWQIWASDPWSILFLPISSWFPSMSYLLWCANSQECHRLSDCTEWLLVFGSSFRVTQDAPSGGELALHTRKVITIYNTLSTPKYSSEKDFTQLSCYYLLNWELLTIFVCEWSMNEIYIFKCTDMYL